VRVSALPPAASLQPAKPASAFSRAASESNPAMSRLLEHVVRHQPWNVWTVPRLTAS
jgi:hypothetical protein